MENADAYYGAASSLALWHVEKVVPQRHAGGVVERLSRRGGELRGVNVKKVSNNILVAQSGSFQCSIEVTYATDDHVLN